MLQHQERPYVSTNIGEESVIESFLMAEELQKQKTIENEKNEMQQDQKKPTDDSTATLSTVEEGSALSGLTMDSYHSSCEAADQQQHSTHPPIEASSSSDASSSSSYTSTITPTNPRVLFFSGGQLKESDLSTIHPSRSVGFLSVLR